jgi:hypothetical protein
LLFAESSGVECLRIDAETALELEVDHGLGVGLLIAASLAFLIDLSTAETFFLLGADEEEDDADDDVNSGAFITKWSVSLLLMVGIIGSVAARVIAFIGYPPLSWNCSCAMQNALLTSFRRSKKLAESGTLTI